jgi:O-succinylbenzoic acid--CoA ligase
VFATYGMTETVTHIAIKKINNTDRMERELFHALPSVKLSLDVRGCLIIDAPKISDDKVITNDIVSLESEFTFEWLGRYDSIINSGGVKLIPEQIENKISKVIKSNFFVSSIHDPVLGEKVILVVEGRNEKSIKNSDIKEFLSEAELDVYQFPKEIYFVDKFIMTETGKIKRTAILKKFL